MCCKQYSQRSYRERRMIGGNKENGVVFIRYAVIEQPPKSKGDCRPHVKGYRWKMDWAAAGAHTQSCELFLPWGQDDANAGNSSRMQGLDEPLQHRAITYR